MPPLDTAAGQRLIPASTTLLQPGSRFFRLADALNFLDQNSYITQLQNQVETLKTQVATLQSQVATLQNQLDGVSFGATAGAPAAGPIARIGTTVNAVSYSMALYAP